MSSDEALWTQLGAASSLNAVARKSAFGFLQGLYPPVNATIAISANGARVAAPLPGYQDVPVKAPEDGAVEGKAEDTRWRLARAGYANAEVSSQGYFTSEAYRDIYDDSLDFYRSLSPILNGTVPRDKANYNHSYSSTVCLIFLASDTR